MKLHSYPISARTFSKSTGRSAHFIDAIQNSRETLPADNAGLEALVP